MRRGEAGSLKVFQKSPHHLEAFGQFGKSVLSNDTNTCTAMAKYV